MKKRKAYREVTFSTDFLKWMGFVCLCMGSISTAIFQQNIIGLDGYTNQSLYDAMAADSSLFAAASAASVLSMLSMLALPVYPKLLVSGWKHTQNQRKYFVRLALCAFVSEIPYDLSVTGNMLDLSRQGPMWSLVIGAVMLAVLRQLGQGKGFLKGCIVIAACAWAVLLQSYLGVLTVLLVAVFFLLEGRKIATMMAGICLCAFQFPAPFGIIFTSCHNEKPSKMPKALFYILYPLQMLLFFWIGKLI